MAGTQILCFKQVTPTCFFLSFPAIDSMVYYILDYWKSYEETEAKQMTIRQAMPEEYLQVLDFYCSVSEAMAACPNRPTWRRGIYPVVDDLIGDLFIAVQENEGIIGAVLVNSQQGNGYDTGEWALKTDKVAVIHLLAVSPKHQGKGIAWKLLTHARDSVHDWAEVIRLDTLVNNTPAKRLYEGFGFHKAGDMEVEYESVGIKQFTLYEYVF